VLFERLTTVQSDLAEILATTYNSELAQLSQAQLTDRMLADI
jgi:hypothetical protein